MASLTLQYSLHGYCRVNLALGQRRADSVKRVMTLAGTNKNQIESVSLGEEKPRAIGHNEASWAENRRADIRYQGE